MLFGYPISDTLCGSSFGSNTGTSNVDTVVSGSCSFAPYPASSDEGDVVFEGSWKFNCPDKLCTDQCLISGTKGSLKFNFFGSTGK